MSNGDGFDAGIVIGFLILTLIVGIYNSRYIATIRDYALGGRNFSTGALVATLVATWISGSFLFVSLAKVYKEGITVIIAYLLFPSIFLLMGYIFVPRMKAFMGDMSIADSMGRLYGEKVEIITAITGAISCLGMVAVQFKIFATVFSIFFSIDETYALLISSMIVILYSTSGGIKSVTMTDIIQFLTFTIFIPVIVFLLVQDVDISAVHSSLQNSHFTDFGKLVDYTDPGFFAFITLLFYFTFPNFPPEIFQRILMAKNITQVKESFYTAFFICLAIAIASITIAILLYCIKPDLESNKIFSYITDNYLSSGIRGLTIIGLIAMIMSSADSNINSSAILLTDVYNTVLPSTDKQSLYFAKIITLLLGVFAVMLALSKRDLLGIILATASFYMPVVNVPLMVTILGFKTSTKSVLIGMAAGFTTSALLLNTNLDAIIPAIFANFIFLFGSHYILRQPGGWNNKDNYIAELTSPNKKDTKVRNFNILAFFRQNAPDNTKTYTLFGIFCFISTISTIAAIYSNNSTYQKHYHDTVLLLYQAMLSVSSFFMLYVILPSTIKNKTLISIVWCVALMFILAFCGMFFVLLGNFGKPELIIFTLNLIIIFVLTRWQFALLVIFVGLLSGILAYMKYVGIEYLNMESGQPYFNLMYVLLLIVTALITFFKPKQEHQERTELEVVNLSHKVTHYSERVHNQNMEIDRLSKVAQRIFNNVNHELRLPIGNVMNFSELLDDALEKLSKKQIKEVLREIHKNSTRICSMIVNMLDIAMLDAKKIKLEKRLVNLGELVEDRIKECRKIYLDGKDIEFVWNIEADLLTRVDPNYIKQTVDNLISNSIKYSENGVIRIDLYKDDNKIYLKIKDDGVGIPEKEISEIFDAFIVSSRTFNPACGRGLGLFLCKNAVRSHDGEIMVKSDGNKGATFTVILPALLG